MQRSNGTYDLDLAYMRISGYPLCPHPNTYVYIYIYIEREREMYMTIHNTYSYMTYI